LTGYLKDAIIHTSTTHKEQTMMQALINLAIVMLPVIIMGLALIIKGDF
jgi:hypothetical protein